MEELLKANAEVVEFVLKNLPWISLGLWALYSILVLTFKDLRKSISNFYIIESIPSVFVTLGLFGTFTGIAFGLLYFDTSPDLIKESIKILLDGLKLAMFTSITGILMSLIFSKIIKIAVNSKNIKPPSSPELLELQQLNKNFIEFNESISTTQYEALVDALKDVLSDFNQVFLKFINELVEQNFEELSHTINQLSEWQRQHKDDVNDLTVAYRELVSKHSEFAEKTNEWVSILDEVSGQSSRLQHVIDQFNEAFNEDGNLSRVLTEIRESTSELKFTTKNFNEISVKMNQTSSAIEATGEKITQWTNSVENVSESSQKIVEKVEALQSISSNHIDNLVDEFNNGLKGTFGTFDALIQEYIKSIEQKIKRN
jgi:gas vesicle protein